MSILLAFQSAPPAEPDFIIQLISEVEDEAFESLNLFIDFPTTEDLIFTFLSEPDEEGFENIFGDIQGIFEDTLDVDLIPYLGSFFTEEETDFFGTIENIIPDAITVVEILDVTGGRRRREAYETEERRQAAIRLGRLGGLKGGPARANALSSRQRSNIARNAALIRWK